MFCELSYGLILLFSFLWVISVRSVRGPLLSLYFTTYFLPFSHGRLLFWLFHQVLIVICLHDAVEGGPYEVEQSAAFGVEQVVAVPDVQAAEAEQVHPSAPALQADDAQGFLIQGAVGFDALHEPEPPLEVLIHIGLHAAEVPQRPFQDEQGVAGGRGAAVVGLRVGMCSLMASLADQPLVHKNHPVVAGCRQAQVHIIISMVVLTGVRQQLYQLPTEHHRVAGNGTVEQPYQVVVGRARVVSHGRAVGGEGLGAARAEQMVANGLHLLFYLLGRPEVVLVADGDVLTPCFPHGTEEVAVDTQPDGIAADPELRMPCRIFLQNVHCTVGGTVVLHQYLQHGIGLLKEGVKLLSQVFLAVESTQYD